MLDSRQLGLKLIANVTYGYTSANFSGRMPCIEVTTIRCKSSICDEIFQDLICFRMEISDESFFDPTFPLSP